MPLYTYMCRKCDVIQTDLFKIKEEKPICRNCFNEMEKVITVSSVLFKDGKSSWSKKNNEKNYENLK